MRESLPLFPGTRPGRAGAHAVPVRHAARSPSPGEHLAALRAAVTDHAGLRRAAGIPLEGVLAEVRVLARGSPHLVGTPDEVAALMARLRLWSLAAYVDVPELRNVPRFY